MGEWKRDTLGHGGKGWEGRTARGKGQDSRYDMCNYKKKKKKKKKKPQKTAFGVFCFPFCF